MDTIRLVALPRSYRQSALRQLGMACVARIEQRLGELGADVEWPGNGRLRSHLREHILPGLAVYQVLRVDGCSQEAALAAFDELLQEVVAPVRRKMSRLGRLPLIYPLLRLVVRPAMRQYPPEGWRIEWVENSREAIRFNMRSCFYFDTLSRHGAPELTASFCRGDDLVYGEMSPHIEFRRTRTIGRGDAYCDFCFANVARRPAAAP